jgi:protein SCO1
MRVVVGVASLGLAVATAWVATAGGAWTAVARTLRPGEPLPVLGHVPPFRLVDQDGAPFTTDRLLGHVSVVDFIFTHCSSSCPRLTARMAELQGRLGRGDDAVRLVSVSVDPENDTPPVLTEYAAKFHADRSRWTFVTGPPDDVVKATVLGFKVSAQKIARGANDYDVVHGNWLVLVDRKGDFRGYYAVEEADGFERLVADARRLESND